jgi:threonine 3-dehydrogenase
MRKPVVLITGAGGEIGHGLIERLASQSHRGIVTLDISRLEAPIASKVDREITGSILDRGLLDRVLSEFRVELVFHLAALLSTRSEFTPVTAHQVNVEGTLNLLEFAQQEGESHGMPVVFLYPSSIAAYGLPDLATKTRVGKVTEDQWTHPTTMYGCNKLYCEQLGTYYARHYKQLAAERLSGRVDFRCVRFPGLISAATVPSGGTSDYAPEMIHAAAKGEEYGCFVRPDTRIPFMAMPDGVEALLQLAAASREPPTTWQPSTRPPRRFATSSSALSRQPTSRGRTTPSARRSSIRGRRTSTTKRRGATGGSRRTMTSIARSQRI